MKSIPASYIAPLKKSLPMRGEWIEIASFLDLFTALRSLPMRGEWIEISLLPALAYPPQGLSPCGESGLKFFPVYSMNFVSGSLPMRGEWIEIDVSAVCTVGVIVSPHAGESGLKFGYNLRSSLNSAVSPHAGRVD